MLGLCPKACILVLSGNQSRQDRRESEHNNKQEESNKRGGYIRQARKIGEPFHNHQGIRRGSRHHRQGEQRAPRNNRDRPLI